MNDNKIFIADKHRLSSIDCDDAEFRAKSSEWYAPEKFDASRLYDFQVARQIDDGSKRPADWLGEDFELAKKYIRDVEYWQSKYYFEAWQCLEFDTSLSDEGEDYWSKYTEENDWWNGNGLTFR